MDTSFGRDLALIWLSLFCLVGLLVPIVGLYFAVRGMNTLQKKSTSLLLQGQTRVQAARQQTDRLSEQAIQPVLRTKSRVAQVTTTVKRIAGRDG